MLETLTPSAEHNKAHPDDTTLMSKIGVAGLVSILRNRPHGLSGPEVKNAHPTIQAAEVLNQLDDKVWEWEGASELTESVVGSINKLVNRQNIAEENISENIASELAYKIATIAKRAEYPSSKNSIAGLNRIILNMPTNAAEHYLSADFIDELRGDAADVPELSSEIEGHFSIRERLRRANSSRNPDDAARGAVKKTVAILQDKDAYIKEVTGSEQIDSSFADTLSPKMLLIAATLSPTNTNELIAKAARDFAQLEAEFPLFVGQKPAYVTDMIVKSGTNGSLQKFRETVSKKDEMIRHSMSRGKVLSSAVAMTLRTGKHTSYETAIGQVYVNNRRSLREKVGDGILKPEHFITTEHSDAYKELLLDIDRRTSDDNRETIQHVLDTVAKIHTHARHFSERLPRRYPADEQYALGVEKAISKRVAELLSIIPELLDGQTVSAGIYRGDALHESVETSDINDVVRGLSAIDYALEKLTEADQTYGQTTTPVEDGIGRFERSDGVVAVAVRPTETKDAEQRIAWNVKMSTTDQQKLFGEVLKDKPLNITLRLDLERIDRALSLDIGGSVEAIRKNQPLNYMLAKLTTIGAQTYNSRTGGDKHRHDYHVREVFTQQQADPAEYQRWITSVMYGLRSDQ